MSIPKYAVSAINEGLTIAQYYCLNCKKGRWFNDANKQCLICNNNGFLKVERSLTSAKKQIIRDQVGKCANPGCSVKSGTQVHHIDEWAVYHSDDPEILIPVCPTCHSAIHNGDLAISKETLKMWKDYGRVKNIQNLHIYVEPNRDILFHVGGLSFIIDEINSQLKVFSPNPDVSLTLKRRGKQISLVDLSITDANGLQTIEMLDNYIEIRDDDLICEERPGHIKITTTDHERYLPQIIQQKLCHTVRSFILQPLTILELEVPAPGQLSIKGCWYCCINKKAIAMTEETLSFVGLGPSEWYHFEGGPLISRCKHSLFKWPH